MPPAGLVGPAGSLGLSPSFSEETDYFVPPKDSPTASWSSSPPGIGRVDYMIPGSPFCHCPWEKEKERKRREGERKAQTLFLLQVTLL